MSKATSEHNPLANIDLGVIVAPRPPAGFAQSVVARFATTEAAITVAKRRRFQRAARGAGAAVAVAAAVLAIVLGWPRGSETGAYATAEPEHLEVGGLAVDLDRGAAIRWTVDHDRLRVDQRGSATWTVPAGQHLQLEVAGVGGVETTNATLHVEAHMNLIDTKMIGATLATAALVTAVVVTVTHGRATVTGAHEQLAVTAGQSTLLAPGKPPIELITAGEGAIAVKIVFSGNAAWTAREVSAMESTIDQVRLPPDSTVSVVSFAARIASETVTLRAQAASPNHVGLTWLEHVSRDGGGTGEALVNVVKQGILGLALTHAPRRVLVVVGDGDDTNGEPMRVAWRELQWTARNTGVELRAVIVPKTGKVDLVHALADAIGGTVASVAPAKAVMVVYEGRGLWLTPDVLRTLGQGITDMDLPPESRIGAIEFSNGATLRIPWEPATSFTPAQLGSARDYADKRGSDLVQGVTMGLAALASAPETDKLLVVIGDGHDTNDAAAATIVEDLLGQARRNQVRIRALQYGSIDSLPGDVLKRLDPKVSWFAGNGYQERLEALQTSLGMAPETAPETAP
ncbi:MAG: hypothetical protein ABI591_18630 [Kofleriaceae bacterium]